MPLNLKQQPVQQHIESKLVESSSIKVGKSGNMKVDPRFIARLPKGSFSKGGYGKVRVAPQILSSQEKRESIRPGSGFINLIAGHKTFSYTLTNKDSKGNPVTILTTIQHMEKFSANTDYYTGHVQGQIASQVAYELQ